MSRNMVSMSETSAVKFACSINCVILSYFFILQIENRRVVFEHFHLKFVILHFPWRRWQKWLPLNGNHRKPAQFQTNLFTCSLWMQYKTLGLHAPEPWSTRVICIQRQGFIELNTQQDHPQGVSEKHETVLHKAWCLIFPTK